MKINSSISATVIIMSLLFAVNLNSFAQSGWKVLSAPSADKSVLWSINFADENNGCAVGGFGLVAWTTNSGNNWRTFSNCAFCENKSVQYVNSKTGFLLAMDNYNQRSVVYKSVNGGLSWEHEVISFPKIPTSALQFVNENTGFVLGVSFLGDRIYGTRDGGISWDSAVFKTTLTSYCMFCLNESICFAAGSNVIYKTTDGWSTWTQTLLDARYKGQYGIENVFFTDEMTGYATVNNYKFGEGEFLKTTDGGASWSALNNIGNKWIRSICFANNAGYAAGQIPSGGFVMKTTDGGQSWSEQTTSEKSLYNVYFINDKTGYVCGDKGIILGTTSGGE